MIDGFASQSSEIARIRGLDVVFRSSPRSAEAPPYGMFSKRMGGRMAKPFEESGFLSRQLRRPSSAVCATELTTCFSASESSACLSSNVMLFKKSLAIAGVNAGIIENEVLGHLACVVRGASLPPHR